MALLLLAASACESAGSNAAGGGNDIRDAAGPADAEVSGSSLFDAADGGTKGTAETGESSSDKLSAMALHGAFRLTLVPARGATAETPVTQARTAFLGLVYDGENPNPVRWIADQSASGCTLYTPAPPLCDPGCGSRAACVSNEVCVPYPSSQAVGAVILKGIGDTPVEMTPIGSSNNYQPKAGAALPYPPCAPGDMLTLCVEGGAYEGFELQTRCIAPLEFKGPVRLERDTPLGLRWQPSVPQLARIQLRLNISHHGGSRGEIRCDVEDSGRLDLPIGMVNRLLDLGVAGFPTLVLTRIVSGGVADGAQPQHVQFIAQEHVEVAVEIDGLTSCNSTTLCPSGQICQPDLTCK